MNLFEYLSSFIIRPSRHSYRIEQLGPSCFQLTSKIDGGTLNVEREDRVIRTKNGLKMHYSFYGITNRNVSQTVIYLHANNGSRMEGLVYMKAMVERQLNLVLLDFTGSGMSEGEYVSLGINQSSDLDDLIEVLTSQGKIQDFMLWGRSMGAVTALLYCSKNIRIPKACIYDSPFSSLQQLVQEVAYQRTGFPEFMLAPILAAVDYTIKERLGICFQDLKIKNKVHLIRCPGLFLTSKSDRFVHHEHCQQLYKLYPASKKIQYMGCDHHEPRSKDTVKLSILFLTSSLEQLRPIYVERTEVLMRPSESDHLLFRTPPLHFSQERMTQPIRSEEREGGIRRISQKLVPEKEPTKISLTQLKAKKDRMTVTPQRYLPQPQIIEQKTELKSKILSFKKGFLDRMTVDNCPATTHQKR